MSWRGMLRPGMRAYLFPLVAGVALAGGAATGHAAIVARALGIPLALGLGEALLSVAEGEEVIVDGALGRLLVAPDAECDARRDGKHGVLPLRKVV